MQHKNSTLGKKLRNYSILAGSALAAAGTAQAQIVYHSLNVVLHPIGGMNGSYAIDLNGDGTKDFDIGWNHHSISGNSAYVDFGQSTGTHIWNRNAAVGGSITTGGNLLGLPHPYSSGVKIGTGIKWFGYQSLEASAGANYRKPLLAQNSFRGNAGEWNGVTNKFMAMRLKSGGHYYYGWLRMTIGQNGIPITLVDDAYQSSPDSSILSGEGVTGISSHALENVSVYSSGKNVFVKYPGATEGITIRVTDMLGKEVRTVQTTNELYEMNLENSAQGIYTVTVKNGQAETSKKISIQ